MAALGVDGMKGAQPRTGEPGAAAVDVTAAADRAFLQRTSRQKVTAKKGTEIKPVRLVDVFAGCGGLTCGVQEAARRRGAALEIPLAVEIDERIASIYRTNFPDAGLLEGDMGTLFRAVGAERSDWETTVAAMGPIDFVVAGPPCQGHSNLNNHTRRSDPKNALYLTLARVAELLEPTVVLIENVPAVKHDVGKIVDKTTTALEALGYSVASEVLDLSGVGVPQRRRRFVLLASRNDKVDPSQVLAHVAAQRDGLDPRTVDWAIRDLENRAGTDPMDITSTPSKDNKTRIDYLHDHKDDPNLPDRLRPTCHKDKPHSYKSVYGRLEWDAPSQTITTGFRSMGQGRYVHPSKRRTITPREAARLQCFPDWFDWGSQKPTIVATAIGNAVPPLLSLRIGERVLELLGR